MLRPVTQRHASAPGRGESARAAAFRDRGRTPAVACALWACAASLGVAGCERMAPARGQVVLYVDTDIDVPFRADTLRVDFLADDWRTPVERRVIRLDRSDLPISFGVVTEAGRPARLRLRLYLGDRLYRLYPSVVRSCHDEADAIVAYTIDRLVQLDAPARGVALRRVVLRGDDLGCEAALPGERPASMDAPDGGCAPPPDVTPEASCAASTPETAAGESEALAAPPASGDSLVGTWAGGQEVDCEGPPPADDPDQWDDAAPCMRGGLFYFGDSRLGPTYCVAASGRVTACGSVPEVAVRLSPFYVDRYEVSVRRFREVWRSGALDGAPGYFLTGLNSRACDYQDSGHDDLPMNCVDQPLAEAFCEARGGTLPTEAQWQYVGSGSGRELTYPWGNRSPGCTDAAFNRAGPHWGVPAADCQHPQVNSSYECCGSGRGLDRCAAADDRPPVPADYPPEGPQPVGAFPCDQTPDGVFDMAGNVKEWVRDQGTAAQITDFCLENGRGIITDPLCCKTGLVSPARAELCDPDPSPEQVAFPLLWRDHHLTHGASWAAPAGVLQVAMAWGAAALDGSCNNLQGPNCNIDPMDPRGHPERVQFLGFEKGFRCVYPATAR